MHIRRLHRWDLTPKEAIALQQELRAEVIADRPIEPPCGSWRASM